MTAFRKKILVVLFIALTALPSAAHAQMSADLDAGGAVKVGQAAADTCTTTIAGAVRYNTTGPALQFCDGYTWISTMNTAASSNAVQSGASYGYIVVTRGKWNGDLKTPGQAIDGTVTNGIEGAHALCYDDLNDNDWMGKTEATARGIFDAAHVKAWLFVHHTGSRPYPWHRYFFARSGDPDVGGAFLDTTVGAVGPGNSIAWAGVNYFGGAFIYHMANNGNSATNWEHYVNNAWACSNYESSSGAASAFPGLSAATDGGRWRTSATNCDKTQRLLCLVHP